jgi:hypothetical protein
MKPNKCIEVWNKIDICEKTHEEKVKEALSKPSLSLQEEVEKDKFS